MLNIYNLSQFVKSIPEKKAIYFHLGCTKGLIDSKQIWDYAYFADE